MLKKALKLYTLKYINSPPGFPVTRRVSCDMLSSNEGENMTLVYAPLKAGNKNNETVHLQINAS